MSILLPLIAYGILKTNGAISPIWKVFEFKTALYKKLIVLE